MHLVDSFNKYFLGTYYVQGTVLGAGALSVNKAAKDPSFQGDEFGLKKTVHKISKQLCLLEGKEKCCDLKK